MRPHRGRSGVMATATQSVCQGDFVEVTGRLMHEEGGSGREGEPSGAVVAAGGRRPARAATCLATVVPQARVGEGEGVEVDGVGEAAA